MVNYFILAVCCALSVFITGAIITPTLIHALKPHSRFGWFLNIGMVVLWFLVFAQIILLALEDEEIRLNDS